MATKKWQDPVTGDWNVEETLDLPLSKISYLKYLPWLIGILGVILIVLLDIDIVLRGLLCAIK